MQDIASILPSAPSSSSSLGSLRKLVGMPSVPSVVTPLPQLLDSVKPLSSKGKEKARMSANTRSFDEEQAMELADGFSRREIVKQCLRRWVRRTADRAAWRDACSKSEAYREKVEGERKKKGRESVRNGSPSEKRRRTNSDISDTSTRASSPAKKRVKRRVSDKYQPPRTDADLVKRLKEVTLLWYSPFLAFSNALAEPGRTRTALDKGFVPRHNIYTSSAEGAWMRITQTSTKLAYVDFAKPRERCYRYLVEAKV